MITIDLNENIGIKASELDVFQAGKTQISGFVNITTFGLNWIFKCEYWYGDVSGRDSAKIIQFDNLPSNVSVAILNEQGQENYPTTDGGYTDYRKDIYRACDRFKQVLEQKNPNLVGQISITGITEY